MIIEKNREGALVIFGDIGRRIYYYYSKKEAIQKYKNELKRKKNETDIHKIKSSTKTL